MIEYAFETLNLNRVWLHVYEYNERGIRAYEKVGFKKEGILRQDHYYGDRYWNTITTAGGLRRGPGACAGRTGVQEHFQASYKTHPTDLPEAK